MATYYLILDMSWNESNKNDRDPWSSGSNQGPPDLDELLGKTIAFFRRMFSGNGGGGGSSSSNNSSSNLPGISLILVVLAIVWLLSGIYIVNEGNRGVVLRFGSYQITTTPGPHWHIPFPIEAVEKVDIDSIRSVQDKTQMLTEDENIVEVELAVQYRVKDAPNYLFKVRRPDTQEFENPAEGTVFQVMESALREVVGKSKMDFILGAGRAEIASETKSLIQTTLDDYESGLEIITVNLQQSQPPSAVQDAFADAIKAREDEVRFINEAEAYANGILPKARGEAARMKENSIAYREKVTANSDGEAQRFVKLYNEYRKAPEVTRKRLYLEAVESVISGSSKVMLDVNSGNSIFYLPFDKMLDIQRGTPSGAKGNSNDGNQSSPMEQLRSKARGGRSQR